MSIWEKLIKELTQAIEIGEHPVDVESGNSSFIWPIAVILVVYYMYRLAAMAG